MSAPADAYANGLYDTSACVPTPSELRLYNRVARRDDPTVRDAALAVPRKEEKLEFNSDKDVKQVGASDE